MDIKNQDDIQGVDEIYNYLLTRYNLRFIHTKYILSSMIATTIKESFYWLLIFFSERVKFTPESINKYATILIIMIGIYVPANRFFTYIKAQFIEEMKISSAKYFNDRLLTISKKDVIDIDLVDHNNILDHFNDNLEIYIKNLKNKYDTPIRFISLVIIALNKNFRLLIVLFFIFFMIVKILNERKMEIESEKSDRALYYEGVIRNFTINGKNNILNDNFNREHLIDNNIMFEKTNREIMELNHNLDMKVNIIMCLFILLVILIRIKDLNQNDFFYYFLIIYDVEYTVNAINEYYKNRANYTKMIHRFNFLNSFAPTEHIKSNQEINEIIITKIFNNKPKLNISNIVISNNDHLLVSGKSGTGKTTLLYVLKGIITADEIIIKPEINDISTKSYMALANKKLPNGTIYEIVSNYNKNYDNNLMDFCLAQSKINIDGNTTIEKLSSGEQIRVFIASIIYNIKTNDYKILLFDEIDQNLNDELAYDICKNIKTIFNDKIIFYITHNEKVKTLFNKKINLQNNV
jgi:ABC-type lipoprotein export system ATPase subunit